MSMAAYRTLLFDLDNTLLDFDRAEMAAFMAAFSASGISANAEMYALYHGINDALWKQLERGEVERERLKTLRYEILLEKLGIDDSDALSARISRTYFSLLGEQRFLLPGALEVCWTLHKQYRMCIITNGSYEVQMGRFYGSGLEPYFTDLFISEKIGAAKPALSFFEKVFSTLGDSDRAHYCVIGDSLSSDIAGADAAGVDAIWLDRTGCGNAQGHTVTHILQDIRQLPAYLSGCERGRV